VIRLVAAEKQSGALKLILQFPTGLTAAIVAKVMAPDAPGAMLTNGRMLCAVSPVPTSSDHYPIPTTFYEYDSFANTFTLVGTPSGGTESYSPYATVMLPTPDGRILYSAGSGTMYVYTPDGTRLAAAKPAILGLWQNPDGSYHLTGTQLNGISVGASYGDDAQMDSNYPIVRLTASPTSVRFARSFNWSSTSIATGSRVVSTEFVLPSGLAGTIFSFAVVANGVASDSISLTTSGCTSAGIGVHPTPVAACVGAQVMFSVTATGSPPLTYRWRKDGITISSATGAMLSIAPLTSADAGAYDCVVSNACGLVTSNAASLTICRADFNCSGAVTVQDLFDFLGAWFANSATADFNGVNGVTVQDLFDFLAAWFTGC